MNILITGHTSGIGNSLLKKFNAEKINVYGISRRISDQIPISNQLDLDLSKVENINKARDWVSKLKFHMFFHCAGTNPVISIFNAKNETYTDCFNLHFLSASQIFRGCLINKDPKDSLKIILLSSIWSLISAHSRGPYSVAKNALNCLAKQIAIEHGVDKVQAISLALGFVKTGLTEITKSDEKIKSAKDRYLFPYDAIPNPDEVADLISGISFNDLSMLNGSTIRLDGGITCQ